jgi:O-antigen/teichoic acid export membrane protein
MSNLNTESLRSAWRAVLHRAGPLVAYGALTSVIVRVGDIAMVIWRLLLGRLLKPVDFGAIDPFLSVMGLIAMPVGILIQAAVKSLSRLLALHQDGACAGLARNLARQILAWSAGLALLTLALSPWLMRWLHLDSPVHIVCLVVLTVLGLWQPFLGAVLQGAQRYVQMSLISAVSPFVMTLLTALLIGVLPWGLTGALLGRVGGGLFTLAWTLLATAWIWRIRPAPFAEEAAVAREMWLPVAVTTVSFAALGLDRLYVRSFLLDDSGGFAAVLTLAQIPLWLVGPVATVLFPLASAEVARGRAVGRLLREATLIGGGITLACVAVFAVAAAPLLRWWNPPFVPYAGLVWIYALAMGLHAVISLLCSLEMARHEYVGIYGMAVPSLIFCGVLAMLRGRLGLPDVLWLAVAARAVILAWFAGLLLTRRSTDASAA